MEKGKVRSDYYRILNATGSVFTSKHGVLGLRAIRPVPTPTDREGASMKRWFPQGKLAIQIRNGVEFLRGDAEKEVFGKTCLRCIVNMECINRIETSREADSFSLDAGFQDSNGGPGQLLRP